MFSNFLDYNFGCFLIIAIMIISSFIFGFVYHSFNKKNGYLRSYLISLMILPLIITSLIIGVSKIMNSVNSSGSNYTKALVSLLAGLLIIRYRSKNLDVLDLTYIFFMMSYSFIMGLGYLYFGLVFFGLILIITIILNYANIKYLNVDSYILKISVPEDLNFENAFDDILKKYTKRYKLFKVKSENMGTTFILSYELEGFSNMKELLDEIRIKNGNMNVLLTKKIDNILD